MKKIFTLLFVLCSIIAHSQSTTVVISQAYSGGGSNTGTPTYKADYVELHNISSTTQTVGGFSIQYGSATGNFGNSAQQIFEIPAGTTIAAGKYLLIQLGTVGSAGVDLPVAADFTTVNLSMGAAAGKVALVTTATPLACGATATACTLPSASIIDLVAWGTSNNAEGGAAVPALSTTTGAVRKNNGCTDTNNNLADFDVVTNPVPRNSSSAAVTCSSTPSPALTVAGTVNGFGNVTVGANSASQTFNLSGANLTGFPGNITVTAPSTDFQVSSDNTNWVASFTIPYTSATLASTPVYVRFTPQTAGVKAGNITIAGGGQTPALTVALNGTGVAASAPTLTVGGTVNDFGTVTVATNSASQSFTVTGANLTGFPGTITITAPSTDFQVSNNNTAWAASTTIPFTAAAMTATTVYVRFTPQTAGAKTGNVTIAGGGATTVTVAVSGNGGGSSAPGGIKISQVYGAGGNTGATYKQDFVELFNSGTTSVDISGWSVQYASATGPAGTGNWSLFEIPAGSTIAAGKYFLVGFATGTEGVNLPLTPDANMTTNAINLSNTGGKVAIVNNNTVLNGTTACSNASVVDMIGYSASNNAASCAEGTAFLTTGIDNAKSLLRKNNGCTDTNDNSADIEFGTINVRNSTSSANNCGGTPAPALTVAGTISNFGNVTVSTNSASQTFNLSGANLTGFPGNITITAPSTDFQVSLDNTTFTASVTIPYTSATLASTAVYVRFTPQTTGVKTGNLTIAGGGQSPALTVALNGTGVAANAPALTVTGTINNFGNVTVATNSASQTFNLSGANLTGFPGNITVTAPSADFQVSLDNTTFTASVNVPFSAATLASTAVYVRFTPQTAGVKTGNLTIAGGGQSPDVTVALNGTGVAAASPTLTVGGTVNSFGSVPVSTNSASQSFTVSGANLTGFPGNITITAPSTDFQVSNNNTTWGATATIPYTAATLAAATAYVRFTPQTAGAKTGNVTVAGGGATTVNIAVSGNGAGANVPANVRISQVYGGGGNTSATYKQDFVELFNPGTTTVNIGGWSVQYGSATGPAGTGNWAAFEIPAGTSIAAGKYYLIGLATGTVGADLPVTPDANMTTNAINIAGASGKVALVNSTTVLNGTTACSDASVMDVFGFNAVGTTTTCGEGTPFVSTGIDNTKSMFRKNNGCTDTNDNSADFELGNVLPRNSTSAANNCGGTVPTPGTLTATALTAFGSTCTGTTVGPNNFTITGTTLTTADVTVAAVNGYTYSTTATGTYTSTLTLTQPGGAFTQVVYVKFAPTAAQSYNGNITVGGGGASAISVAVSGAGINTPAAVTTVAASAIGQNTAQLNATITTQGCSATTAYGFEYSSIAGFANGTGISVASTNLATNNFSANLTGLALNTTYYFKAFTQSGTTRSYGAEMSFKTGALADGFVLYNTPVLRGGTVHFSLSSIKPGHYAAAIYNSVGQKVFKKEMLIQVPFVNETFSIPSTLPAGVYVLQIENYEFKVRKQFIIN